MSTSPSQRKLSRWNRRQRKKHHAGEFQELGFSFWVCFEPALTENQLHAFLDSAIGMFEANDLYVGGLGGSAPTLSTSGIVVAGKGSVTEAQRQTVLAWMQTWPGAAQVKATELRDAWYGDFDDFDAEDAT
ncbi:50S ribosome-binding protein YggL [Thauera butanivorans]|uniref:50S ribosome-binding protein YggL n=1 Tax=Thauera butanivorans TaxID=86174 RepID=UPI003AB234B8